MTAHGGVPMKPKTLFVATLSLLTATGCSSNSPTSHIDGFDVGSYQAKYANRLETANTKLSRTLAYSEKAGQPITWQEIFNVTDIGNVTVSPTGDKVAFFTRRADVSCNCYDTAIQLYDFQSNSVTHVGDPGQPFVSVLPNGGVIGTLLQPDIQWSRDGRYLSYVINKDRTPMLVVYETEKKEAHILAADGDPIFGYVWATDPDEIIFQTGEPRPQVLMKFQHGQESGFRYDEQFEYEVQALPVLPSVPVALHESDDGTLYGSPRSAISVLKRVTVSDVVTSARDNDVSYFEDTGGSSTFGLENVVVFEGLTTKNDTRLRVDSEGKIVDTWPDGDREVSCHRICDGKLRKIFNQSDDTYISIRTNKGRTTLSKFRLDNDDYSYVETPIVEFSSPSAGDSNLGSTCDSAKAFMVCVIEEPNGPPFLARVNAGGVVDALFDPNQNLRARRYSKIERIEISSGVGVDTYANLHYPTNYQSGKKYPLVVVQYRPGGFARGGTGSENPIIPYSEAGFFVLDYGLSEDWPDEGTSIERATASFHSRQPINAFFLNAILDELSTAALIDRNRVAVTGFSAGANVIDYLLANDFEMSATIYSFCCPGPDNALLSPSSIWDGRIERFGAGNPIRDPDYRERYNSWTPVPHVEAIDAAILANIAEHEAFAYKPMLAWMRGLGKPMEVFIYADEHHVKTKPSHRAAIYQRNIQWLKFWLLGEEATDPVDADQYMRWRKMRDERCARKGPDVPSYCRLN